jgi:hypothetical protein
VFDRAGKTAEAVRPRVKHGDSVTLERELCQVLCDAKARIESSHFPCVRLELESKSPF